MKHGIRLLIQEISGYRLYMLSNGFEKMFYITDTKDVFAVWDENNKGKMFDSIIEASWAFDDILSMGKEVEN